MPRVASLLPPLAMVLAVVLGGTACEPSVTRLDLCGRGDRTALAAALDGGSFVLETLDDDGDVIASSTVPATGAQASLALGGAARLRVRGLDLAGTLVAEGEAPLEGATTCLCLAVAGQTAACAGVTCRAEAEGCAFFDETTGEPAGSRAVTLAAADTVLVASEPTLPHGADPSLIARAGERVVLLRFDARSIPRTAVIEDVTLALTLLPPPTTPSGVPIDVVPVLEPWSGAQATWIERSAGVPWSTPGCGETSCGAPWATFDPEHASERQVIPLGLHAAPWIADPALNHGVALIADGAASTFWSADGRGAGAAAPELVVRLHMADDDLPRPTDGPLCGNGLLEGGEACDDGDRDDLDGCTSACAIARCGDGFVRAGVEECDDGDTEDQPECTSLCLRCDDPNALARHVGPDGRCYERYTRASNFGTAENACDARGHGTLASFATVAEQNQILTALAAPAVEVWIGATDRVIEGVFEEPAARPVAYTAWAVGEPDPAGDGFDCVAVLGGLWLNLACGANRGYVCERGGWRIAPDGRAFLPVVGPRITWDAARLECAASDAHLATITTEDEIAATTGLAGGTMWIGLSETDVPGVLAWVTGELAALLNFAGSPSLDGDTFCAHVAENGRWAIAGCANTRRFLCEAD